MNKYCLMLLCCLSLASAKKLEVSLYYESLCPDSVRFITQQLHSAYQGVQKYINLDLIPFGFARANNASGHWRFQCQHGPRECYYNKIHSCVIANNSIATSVEFINCVMSYDGLEKCPQICANSTNISWDVIKNCLSSGEADELLVENGRKTRAVTPPISYIPTIIFNNVYNKEMQHEAEKHFLKVVCGLLKNKPDVCKKLGFIYNIIM